MTCRENCINLDWLRIIGSPEETSLHPRVAPQPLHDHPQLVRELAILPWSRRHGKELPGVVLQEIETGGVVLVSEHAAMFSGCKSYES